MSQIVTISGGGAPPPVPTMLPTNLFRYGEQGVWSTQLYAASTAIANTSSRIFSTPQGQQGQGFANALTIAETNLKTGGMVPAGVAYDVFGIAAEAALTTSTADAGTISQQSNTAALVGQVLNIIHNTVLTWDFTQTQVDIAPVLLCGAGGGAYGALAGAGQATPNEFIGTVQNGNGNVWMYRKHPVALPGQSVFAILARVGSRAAPIGAGNGMTLRVVLLGYYKNVIEIG